MTKSEREWIQREFDQTRELVTQFATAFNEHVVSDTKFQTDTTKELAKQSGQIGGIKWLLLALISVASVISGWFGLR